LQCTFWTASTNPNDHTKEKRNKIGNVVTQHCGVFSWPLLQWKLNNVFCFFHTISQRYDFRKNIFEDEMCVLIFSTTLSETFLILRKIQGDIIINVQRYPCNVTFILLRFYESWILSTYFFKNPLISDFMKIRPVGDELLHSYRQAWRS